MIAKAQIIENGGVDESAKSPAKKEEKKAQPVKKEMPATVKTPAKP